ncbi:cAMP-binding domain of CRP or a regulatory subunit of cAMP-dependent protein kinases [Parapedobacter luteus]|uniref:cAMP-binding domain of CRP or a regulatory subunit of cAMP-dependent protein kinases n=1 Tax=Parapedobacter luteus TaxID=623280 RepID=A0A1T5BDH6_9SPHI|nr:Crp/Fnr family transcriptional regulator [Parapedobacter luteus]SKB44893.1 cAMP-binding domain of CRP or a regulatory subunit of cAMP-dependent protein kinases [Parapedobacter luteus]
MFDPLKTHINKFAQISDDEFQRISTYFQHRILKKKENLLVEGQVCRANYFVLNGILRKFFINDKGVEQTTEFAIENWWMTETFSYLNKEPTPFYIQAVQQTDVLVIQQAGYDNLLQEHPVMERYFRCIYQKAYAAAQMRIKFIYEHSREELYHHFRKNQPEFLQRVPQYLVASYLGFTPEYLSEIRKKKFS